MADRSELCWLAGLLEGEGCFQLRPGRYCSAFIQLMMTDKDVVIRAAEVMGAHKVVEAKNRTKGGKRIYRTNIYGGAAIRLMRRLRPLMGSRRRARIDEILAAHWSAPKSRYPERKPYSRGAKVIWLKAG